MQDQINENIFLIAGLGNPGREYRQTRHNIGFMTLDRLAGRLEQSFSRLESHALVAKGTYQQARLILAKPQTFMNESSRAVVPLLRFYKVQLSNLIVVYDDVDLPLGVLRLRPGGGSAGQKGMQSIITRLSSEEFPRLRIGIGRPPGRLDAADYVLQEFNRAEAELLPQVLDRAVDAILLFATNGINQAMNVYNGSGKEDI